MSQEQAAAAVKIVVISIDESEKWVWNHSLKEEKTINFMNSTCRTAVRRQI